MKKGLIILTIMMLFLPFGIHAEDEVGAAQQAALTGLEQTNSTAQLQEGDPAKTIGAAIGVLLSIMGLIFLIIVIYAGMMWMTASGDSGRVEKARKMLIEGAIGLAITLAAYTFTAYVVGRVTETILQ